MSKDLQLLAELIDRLNSTPIQSSKVGRAKNKLFSDRVFAKMWDGGGTFGEASGTMPWLNGPDAPQKLRELDGDLGAQIGMVSHILDNWSNLGEPIPPAYGFRIAVILRKMKRPDLEAEFLRSYGRHFISHHPGTQSYNLRNRIEKVLGLDESEPLWALSEVLEERPENLRSIKKLGVFPRNHRLLANGHHHFDFEFVCKRCCGRKINVPDDQSPDGMVRCSDCSTAFGTFGDLKSYCEWLALEKIRDENL